jgi:uncharacterized membrane protein
MVEVCLDVFVKREIMSSHVLVSPFHVVRILFHVSPNETLLVLVSEVVGFVVLVIAINYLDDLYTPRMDL